MCDAAIRVRVLLAFLLLGLLATVAGAGDDAPSIEQLVDRVRNGTNEEFVIALDALAAMGPAAAAAVPHLVDNLDPPDDGRRSKLSTTLVAIGEPALPALVSGLMSWSGHTTTWCMRTIGKMGERAAPAVPRLVEGLDGAHPETQVEILRALAGIGDAASDALPDVDELVSSPAGEVRVEVARTLARLGPDAKARLAELAVSEDAAVAAEARKLLGASAPEARGPSAATVERLRALLEKGSEKLRVEAARAIGVIGPKAAELLPVLEKALADRSVHVRRAVIQALAALGPAADRTVDRLLALLESDDDVRDDVLRALPFLGKAAEKAIPAVAGWLADGESRHQAAFALTRFGEAAVPALAKAAGHTSYRVREAAVRALAGIERAVDERLPVFVAALEDESSAIRFAACDALGALGARARPAIDALRGRLTDEAEGVRVAAARAMFAAGERGGELAPAFIEGLTSRTIWLFEEMDDRLVALGSAAVPALADAMAHVEAVWLGEVCARIGKPAIPAMLRGLENPRPSSRRAALEALRAVEADGGFLLLPIVARLKDENRSVRGAAAKALVPFVKTCPEALVEHALPDLLAFYDREVQWSDEEQAVQQALLGMGELAIPALRAKLQEAEDVGVRAILRRVEEKAAE